VIRVVFYDEGGYLIEQPHTDTDVPWEYAIYWDEYGTRTLKPDEVTEILPKWLIVA
jgi:hypothetical protein